MKLLRIQAFAVMLACLMLGGQAFAQNALKSPAGDDEFLVGLRRVGVMAGQVIQCAPDADRKAKIDDAMQLANQIVIYFGLKAAFNFVGAVGYGSGHEFDKAGCAQSNAGWQDVLTKYMSK
jgi:hypothetical protein